MRVRECNSSPLQLQQSFDVMGIAYTHADGNIKLEEAQEHADSITDLLHTRTGSEVSHLPCWQLENHPEAVIQNEHLKRFLKKEKLEALKDELQDHTVEACGDLLRWARANEPISTSAAKVATYEYREEQKNMEAEKAKLEKNLEDEKLQTQKANEELKKSNETVSALGERIKKLELAPPPQPQVIMMPGGGGMDMGGMGGGMGGMGGMGGGMDRGMGGYDQHRRSSRTPSVASSSGGGNLWNWWRRNEWQGGGTRADMSAQYRTYKRDHGY
jgi:hypothetical protein